MVSKSTWWAGVKDGRFPKPVKLGVGDAAAMDQGLSVRDCRSEARSDPWKRNLEYLNSRAASKQKCQLHECYCFSCRKPKAPALGMADYIPLTASSGNLRALCETCSTIMHKRVAVARLEVLKAVLDVTVMHEGERIGESTRACLNDDL